MVSFGFKWANFTRRFLERTVEIVNPVTLRSGEFLFLENCVGNIIWWKGADGAWGRLLQCPRITNTKIKKKSPKSMETPLMWSRLYWSLNNLFPIETSQIYLNFIGTVRKSLLVSWPVLGRNKAGAGRILVILRDRPIFIHKIQKVSARAFHCCGWT